MASLKRTVSTMGALFLGMALMFLGNGLLVSSASIQLKQLGFAELAIGIVNASYFFGAILSTIFAHRIVSKVGHIRSFGIFTILFGISAMYHSMTSSLVVWVGLRFVVGFCYYALTMIIESWLNERTPNSLRSRVLAVYEVVFYLSFGLGVLLMSVELEKMQVFIIAASFIMVSSIPLNLIRIHQPKIPQKEALSLPKVFGVVPLALACALVGGVVINGFFSMGGAFALSLGLSAKLAPVFMFVAMVGGFCGHFFIAPLSDKFGRKLAIITVCVVSLISASCFMVFDLGVAFAFVAGFFLGSGAFCLYALALARANDVLKDRSKSLEVGRALLFSYLAGSLASPVLLGTAMQIDGARGFMGVYVLLLGVLLVFALTQKSVPKSKRYPYQPHTIRTTAIDDLSSDGFKG